MADILKDAATRERVARAIANSRSARRTPTARRVRGGPYAHSLEIARMDADAALAEIEAVLRDAP